MSAQDQHDMTLDTCISSLQATLPAYREFAAELTSTMATIASSERTLSAVQSVTKALVSQEAEFTSRVARLRVLYNALAARSNTLAAWMQQEISVRDRLSVYLNTLYELHATEKSKLLEMTDALAAATRKLGNVESRSSAEIGKIANAQLALFVWSYEVTQAVDTHTVKLDSLAENTKFRVTQISTSTSELKRLAIVAKALAIKYNEAHLSESLDSTLARLGVSFE